MLETIEPTTLIDRAVLKIQCALAIFLIVFELPYVYITLRMFECALTFFNIIYQFSYWKQ